MACARYKNIMSQNTISLYETISLFLNNVACLFTDVACIYSEFRWTIYIELKVFVLEET